MDAQLGCDLFESCKRIPFVAAVSAMGTTAGFLRFQGANSAHNSHQIINIEFSYNKSESLYLEENNGIQSCNYTTSRETVHSYEWKQNCSCNTCESSCHNESGFQYMDAPILEGFDYALVGGCWGGVIFLSISVRLCCKRM